MGKQNRLRVLQVRHAGHRHIEILRSLLDERPNEASESRQRVPASVAHEEPKIGNHKFVAAASGVQFVP